MTTRFPLLLTAAATLIWLPSCAAASDVDLLSYDGVPSLQATPRPDAPPVELTPPVVMETPAPAASPQKTEPAKPAPKKIKTKKAEAKKPEAEKPVAEKAEPEKTEPVAAEKPKPPAAPAPLLLKAGDVIRVDVKDEPDLSGSFPISADGKITLPLLGEKQAAGLTLIDLKTAITAAYKNGYLVDPKLSLSKEVAP